MTRLVSRHPDASPSAVPGSARRAVGRIGGVLGPADPGAVARLAGVLGPNAQILDSETPQETLVADRDCCRLGGTSLGHPSEWFDAVRAGRLPEVLGAFALAWRDGGTKRLLAANLSPSPVAVLLPDGLAGRVLDAESFDSARRDAAWSTTVHNPVQGPLQLGPHAVLFATG